MSMLAASSSTRGNPLQVACGRASAGKSKAHLTGHPREGLHDVVGFDSLIEGYLPLFHGVEHRGQNERREQIQ